MTSPADQDVDNKLGGQLPTGGVAAYQFAPEAGGRVTYSSDDATPPYLTNFGSGDVVGSAATYDQVVSELRAIGSRFVDPLGNLVTPKKAWLVDWFWKLDGCPMPLPRERMLQYIGWANELNPWPAEIVALWTAKGYTLPAAEQVADYSTVNPQATLDSFDAPSA